jgi:signal transduction histidine kinase
MSRKKHNYIPKKSPNPVLVNRKLDELKKQVMLHGKNIDAIGKSHDTHITMLSNFARHDIKNSVQSMDSILGANTLEELTPQHLENLKLNLNIIRETIENFSRLVPYSENDYFNFDQLVTAVELLNRENFYINKIKLIKEIPEADYNFNLPFQSVLQMINNIIINASKAFDDSETQRKIKIEATFDHKFFYLKIYDNASKISFKDINSIFDYGVSSTGGSGIGLYHAKYLCNLYKGKIEVLELPEIDEYNKFFLITLPTLNDKK